MQYIDTIRAKTVRRSKLHGLGRRGAQKDSVYLLNTTDLESLVQMEFACAVDLDLYVRIDRELRQKWKGGDECDKSEFLEVYREYKDEIQTVLDDYMDAIDMSYLASNEDREEKKNCDIMTAIELRVEDILGQFAGNLRYMLQGGYQVRFCKLNQNESYVLDVMQKLEAGDLSIPSRTYMYKIGVNKIDREYGVICQILGRRVRIGNVLQLRV